MTKGEEEIPLEAIAIAIIVAIIGAIANKKKLEKTNGGKQVSNPMTLFGKMNQPLEREKTSTVQPTLKNVDKEKMEVNHQVYRDDKLDLEIQADHLKNQEEYYIKKLEATKKQVERVKKDGNFLLLSDKKDIVNGIILSEVLGPPRSKRPYHRK
jgi:hypothetical protein